MEARIRLEVLGGFALRSASRVLADDRGLRELVVRKVCAVAGVLLLALSVASCAKDPAVTYLEGQPEYNLTYPGAALVSTTTGGGGLIVHSGPYVTWEFTSSSTLADVGDWYAAELGRRNWVGGLAPQTTGSGGGPMYSWQRPCLILSVAGYPPIADQTHYEVTLVVDGEWQRASQLQSLRDRPEASIAPGGAAQLGTEMFSATLQPGGTLLFVQRSYRWSEGRLAALQFYDNSLVALGWTRVKPPGSEPLDNATAGTWQKGSVLARLTFKETTSLTFTLNESVDAQGSPVPPPSAS